MFIYLFLALGLAMDSLAAAIAIGLRIKESRIKHAFETAFIFGLCQMITPIVGWWIGSGFKEFIASIDHWVAFISLGFIGGRMIYHSLKTDFNQESLDHPNWLSLVILALITSIDALIIGINFAFLETSIITAISMIGLVTFILVFVGVWFGNKLGNLALRKSAEIFGGLILIGIGIKILIEHLFIRS